MPPDNISTTKVATKEYERLLKRDRKLSALEAGGVDNWEWYYESLKEYNRDEELDDLIDGFLEYVNDSIAEADIDQPAGTGAGFSVSIDEITTKEALKEALKDFIAEYDKLKEDS